MEEAMIGTTEPTNLMQKQRAASEFVKLIRKLRWIGMEDEAERLQQELKQRLILSDTVVALPRETD
jgi:hypothetical protein